MDEHTSLEGMAGPMPHFARHGLLAVTPVKHDDEWATPWPIFHDWAQRLMLNFDVAASAKNHKIGKYWTIEDDSLSLSWAGLRAWCNPPWSLIDPWVQKALSREAEVACLLLPARTDRPWHRALRNDERVFIQYVGRVAFIDPAPPPGKPARVSPREGAMIAVVF